MSTLIIASQMPAAFNQHLRAQLPAGVSLLEQDAQAALASRAHILIAPPTPLDQPRPDGWPGSIQWVQLLTSGIDRNPSWTFSAPQVSTGRGCAAPNIAEYVLAALLSANRHIPDIWLQSPADWRPTIAQPLAGSTLGILGFGAIGQATAQRALAFGVQVIALRQSQRPAGVDGVELTHSLQDLLERSDHLLLALPGNEQTRRIIDQQALRHARPNLHLVNVARGSLIDDDALLAFINAHPQARATLDVSEPEPLPTGHPFYTHPRIRLSAHISPRVVNSHEHVIAKFLRNLAHFQAGEPLEDAVPQQGNAHDARPDA